MSAQTVPLPRLAGGRGKSVLSRREVEAHLRNLFPGLSSSAANRSAREGLEAHRLRPEVDPLAGAIADVRRRSRLIGLRRLRGPDPTGDTAVRNVLAGVGGDLG